MSERERKPNPGSDEAIDLGCTCPVLDNNHGRRAPWPPDGWWQKPGCPVHGMGEQPAIKVKQGQAPDLVVVPRRWQKIAKQGRRKQLGFGWTLHLASCTYAKRASTAQPAPPEPYPHTQPCIYCKPTGDTGKRITRNAQGPQSAAARERAKQEAPKQHTYKYREVLDDQGDVDEVEAMCQVCDVTARGPSRGAARVAAYRVHQARLGRRRVC